MTICPNILCLKHRNASGHWTKGNTAIIKEKRKFIEEATNEKILKFRGTIYEFIGGICPDCKEKEDAERELEELNEVHYSFLPKQGMQ